MSTTDGFPSGSPPATTPYTKNATTTPTAGFDSLEFYDASEMPLVYVDDFGQLANPFFATLTAVRTSGTSFGDVKMGEKTTNNYPEYKFLEQDSLNRVYTTSASALVGATTLVFTSTTGLQRGDQLRNSASNEIVRVASVTNGTDVVVLRSTGTLNAVAAKAVGSGDKFIFMGSTVPVGEAGRTAFWTTATTKMNYIQKIVTSLEINEGDGFSAKYGTNKKQAIADYMRDMLNEQLRSVEYVALFGQKATGNDATTGKPWYSAEGVINTALRGYTADLSGALTIKNITKEFGRTVSHGGGVKIVLLGSECIAEFYDLFDSQIARESIKDLDLNVDVLTINGTKFILKEHPFMDSNSGWSKYAVVVDVKSFMPVYPTGSDMNGKNVVGKTRFEYLHDQSNYATQKGEYVSYLTFMNSNALANGAYKIVA